MVVSQVAPCPTLAEATARGRFRSATVVFVGHPATRFHRLLRAGFRHCFVAIEEESGWLLIDPLKHRIEVRWLHLPAAFDLAGFYAKRGHRVLQGGFKAGETTGAVRLEWMSCVAVVKRILALDCPAVRTPYQLHRHLRERIRPAFVPVRAANSGLDSRVK